ncbi:MAG: hypothetical protein NC079_01755 [Clostridium sp.]|nr:hypothetical protein [Acetatifactor muris]MCM1526561.1 hypothetical protein [Bacteroides sp.]MCM1562313.1 hypothetical protein [Clostridium sp.]
MIKPARLFLYDDYKGTRDYLRVQGHYELARTILYFAISLSLFVAGILATGDRMNLLTIVAVLGCLPACKSAIDTFMFMRYKGCSAQNADEIDAQMEGLQGLYDRVFTSYDRNFQVAHITVKGNTLCGFTQDPAFEEQLFREHITGLLKKDGFADVSVKIFDDIRKYTDRLEQLKVLDTEERNTEGILNTLKDVSL